MVLSISPSCGVGFFWFILSRKIIPGSPLAHAASTILSNIMGADTRPVSCLVLGFISPYSSPCSTASMNLSVRATEMLKLLSLSVLVFAVMNFSMSGWSTLNIPMFAPRRVPPCFIVSVATSKMVMNDMGPLATPCVLLTLSPSGRILENEKPVPPPLLWIMAVCFTVSNMLSMESSTGRTKQADNWPSSLPAFMSVGELGMKRNDVISS